LNAEEEPLGATSTYQLTRLKPSPASDADRPDDLVTDSQAMAPS